MSFHKLGFTLIVSELCEIERIRLKTGSCGMCLEKKPKQHRIMTETRSETLLYIAKFVRNTAVSASITSVPQILCSERVKNTRHFV